MQDENATAEADPGMPDPPTLDLRGLKCPLPALRTRRALGRLAPGQLVLVLCTDPLAGLDIPNLVRETGDVLLASARDGQETRFTIRRTGSAGPRGTG